MSLAARVALAKAAPLLLKRLGRLQERLEAGEEGVWPDFLETVKVLAGLTPASQPGSDGAMLTTKDMAERLGISPKTLLRRRKNGEIRPAVQRGKLLRWTGQERL